MRRTPPLILGAGPAGCAAAIALAAAGVRPSLIERTRETGDALCGGFLSWRTLEMLERLGVEPATLRAPTIRRVRLFAGARRAEAPLPAPALAVSRRTLDTALLARAAAAGVAVERGVTVRSVEDGAVRLADGAVLTPEALFLASGKHDVRGAARPAEARGRDPTLGLRVRLPASRTRTRLIGDAVELHLFAGGYAGLAIQEDGSANLCLAVRRSAVRRAGTPAALLRALAADGPLGERIGDADLDSHDAVANVPYGWRATRGRAGLFRLGDQAGVIPSLAGEGIGIALASGRAAAERYGRDGAGASERWQPAFAARLRRPLAVAGLLRHAAEGPARGALVVGARLAGLTQVMAALTRIGQGIA